MSPNITKITLFTLTLMLSTLPVSAQPPVPAAPPGYTLVEKSGYAPANLYTYIDGGCEVYLAHKFNELFTFHFEKPGAPDIIADIFDMGSKEDAYGVYHHDIREGKDGGIGEESEITENALFFWKGKYFVSVIAFDSGEEVIRNVGIAAHSIADGIPPDDKALWFRNVFTGAGVMKEPVKYFHHQHCLENLYFLADENLLDLNEDTDCVFGKLFGEKFSPDRTVKALLIRYKDKESAEKAFKHFHKVLFPEVKFGNFMEFEIVDGLYSGCILEGNYIICAFEVENRDIVKDFLNRILKNVW